MKVTSFVFFAAAFIAALIYHRLPRKWANAWLLVLSIGFVVSWSWQFVLVLIAFAAVNYLLGRKIDPSSPSAGRWTAAGIVFNVAFLFFLKYNHFYLPALSKWLVTLGWPNENSALVILIPIGLSFLMVQAISYLLDVKNRRLQPETDLIRFAVYLYYFPKLLSGPIERARQFIPRLENPLPLTIPLFERSIALLLIGLFRKIAIADPLFNMIPAAAFTSPLDFAGQQLFFYLLAYSFALYNDFAGYTAIVRAVSLWFGIELNINFNLPYLSHNFTEFWSRWHISLSNWLRDYIFFPLARFLLRHFKPATHWINLLLPPLVTMLVSGAWHGLTWNLIFWGALHGIYQIVERLFSLRKGAVPIKDQPVWLQRLATLATFSLTALAWVPFRMPLDVAFQYWKGLLLWTHPNMTEWFNLLAGARSTATWSQLQLPSPILILVLIVAILFDLFQNRAKRDDFILTWSRGAIIIFVVVLSAVALLASLSDQVTPFVYQGF